MKNILASVYFAMGIPAILFGIIAFLNVLRSPVFFAVGVATTVLGAILLWVAKGTFGAHEA